MFKAVVHGLLFMGEMLYQGKVKQVWSTDDPDILEFRFHESNFCISIKSFHLLFRERVNHLTELLHIGSN